MILAMAPLALSDNYKLAIAILVGIAFGFVLIKADFPIRKSVISALTFKSAEISKAFLVSLAAGCLLFYLAQKQGAVQFHVRDSYFWPSLLGAILAGIGFALCSRVPVTAVAALAAGRLYVVWTLLGMILAIPCVNIASEWLGNTIYSWGSKLDSPSLPDELFSFANPLVWIVLISTAVILLLQFTIGGGGDAKGGEAGAGKKPE